MIIVNASADLARGRVQVALLAFPLLTSCYAAGFLIGHEPVLILETPNLRDMVVIPFLIF